MDISVVDVLFAAGVCDRPSPGGESDSPGAAKPSDEGPPGRNCAVSCFGTKVEDNFSYHTTSRNLQSLESRWRITPHNALLLEMVRLWNKNGR